MIKKIALISVWNHNYGSLLQTYAIQTFLKQNGFENEIILYQEKKMIRKIIRFINFSYLKSKVKIIYRNFFVKIFYPEINEQLSIRYKEFEDFKKNKLAFSSIFIKRRQLIEVMNNYTGVVLGSDQIWHPANLLMDFFTLNFVPEHITKIAYAPSFGIANIPFFQTRRTKSYLKRFDFLSTREISGKKIIKKNIKKEVPVVCDPTLLINKQEWDKLKGDKKVIINEYILCYFLGTNPVHRDFANRLKAKTGLQIVALQHLDEFVKDDIQFGDIKPFNIGPAEFINLISNANYVLTDSFHCTIFSVIYQKKFFTFNRHVEKKTGSTNSRISSILSLLNLEERKASGTENISDLVNKEINYLLVYNKLDKFISHSKDYFTNALSGIEISTVK